MLVLKIGGQPMELSVGLNSDKSIMKMENPCTGTFLLLNKMETIKLKKNLDMIIQLMSE
jgi:hypothetical protein